MSHVHQVNDDDSQPAGTPHANHYASLGVDITASAEDIRVAYRGLARLWHPDRHRGNEAAKHKFQEIQGAYEVLSDPPRRQTYDLGLLDLLDVKDYLNRFKQLILTPNGLGMQSRHHVFQNEHTFTHPHQQPFHAERRRLPCVTTA